MKCKKKKKIQSIKRMTFKYLKSNPDIWKENAK